MNFKYFRNSFLFVLIYYSLSTILLADFFKWEILVSEKGYGTGSFNIPIVSEGKIDLLNEEIICSLQKFWT